MEGVSLNRKCDCVGEDMVVEIVDVEKWERGCSSAAAAALRRRGAGTRGMKVSSGSWGSGLSAEVLVRAGGERRPDGGGERGVNPFSSRETRFR